MSSKYTYFSAGLLCAWLLVSSWPALAQSVESAESVEDATEAETVADKDRRWAATLYTVWLSEEQLGDMLMFKSKLEDSQLWVGALSYRLFEIGKSIDAEVEGQVGKHAGPVQRHWEVNALGILRWKTFPWNNYVDTTGAVGLGVSYAFEEPEFEVIAHEKTNRLLAYILVELTFAIPSIPEWAVVARIHHRSSAYGLFEDDIQGASNAAGVGIKYRF